jgi:hypothetical protein
VAFDPPEPPEPLVPPLTVTPPLPLSPPLALVPPELTVPPVLDDPPAPDPPAPPDCFAQPAAVPTAKAPSTKTTNNVLRMNYSSGAGEGFYPYNKWDHPVGKSPNHGVHGLHGVMMSDESRGLAVRASDDV